MYLQQAPELAMDLAIEQAQKEKIIAKLDKLSQKTPSKISRKALKHELKKDLTPKQSGFLASYAGYSDYSNSDGLIHFPLRQEEQKLYMVITEKIKLAKVKGETISHLEFDTSNETKKAIYLFEKKKDIKKIPPATSAPNEKSPAQQIEQKNKKTETKNNNTKITQNIQEKQSDTFYWHITKVNNYKDKKINPISVIILTKPKNIYVVTGDFITDDSAHFILPQEIYSVGNIDNHKIILNELDIKKYFEPIDENEEKADDTIIKKILNNV
jgi:hypothetical protein